MEKEILVHSMSRRQLLSASIKIGSALAVGSSFVASATASWAMEVKHLKSATMATLIQMARDIYPHDNVADHFYATAVKGYDSIENKEMVEAGIEKLNTAAVNAGHASYMDIGWEADRVDILRSMDKTSFFQTIRGGLVTGLYNQKEVWPIFGYEGESFSKGGYIDRGFNDINWI